MDCEKCGACCAHAGNGAVAMADDLWIGHTVDALCTAFRGQVGGRCRCAIYERRPDDCREFEAGSEECLDTRRIAGL